MNAGISLCFVSPFFSGETHIYWIGSSFILVFSDKTASYSRCITFRLRVAHLAARWFLVYRRKWEILIVCLILAILIFSKDFKMQSNKDSRKEDLLNELASDYANYLVVDSNDEVRAIARI